MMPPSDWFTQVRLRRLVAVLDSLPIEGHRPQERNVALWRSCGGPFDEIGQLVFLLLKFSLIEERPQRMHRTRRGNDVWRDAERGDKRRLGLNLIRSGCFHDQACLLIEHSTMDDAGNLVCAIKQAQMCAPQLVAVLFYWPEVSMENSQLSIPSLIAEELGGIWAQLPSVESQDATKKEVGNRAELYSYQFERESAANPTLVSWVARDDESLGYDLENRSEVPSRFIEVKGSRRSDVMFFMSDNEWQKARVLGERYVVHFWGSIDLNHDLREGYDLLRARGYPKVFSNFHAQAGQTFNKTVVKWKFERSDD